MSAPAAPSTGPVALAAAARTFYGGLAGMAEQAGRTAAAVFDRLDPDALAASWDAQQAGERLFVSTAASQALAAMMANRYVDAALAAQGVTTAASEQASAGALTAVASDGRDLESLLERPLVAAAAARAVGGDQQGLQVGQAALATIVETQVSDAGRAAAQIAIAARPEITGFVRMLTPPACGQCAILAGRTYRWSSGFERHPRCDCVHIPAVEDAADDLRTDPDAYFHSLSAADQDRYFGKAAAAAIRLGADIGQVVNARRSARGLSRPGRLTAREQKALRGDRARGALRRVDVYGRQVRVTTEGVTKRGLAGQRLAVDSGFEKVTDSRYQRAKTPRLMPDAILEIANGDQDETRRLLHRFGYLL